MMVVPVLMTSCQFSEKPKNGPDMAQTTTKATASTNVAGLQENSEMKVENFEKNFDASFRSWWSRSTSTRDRQDGSFRQTSLRQKTQSVRLEAPGGGRAANRFPANSLFTASKAAGRPATVEGIGPGSVGLLERSGSDIVAHRRYSEGGVQWQTFSSLTPPSSEIEMTFRHKPG